MALNIVNWTNKERVTISGGLNKGSKSVNSSNKYEIYCLTKDLQMQ